jgi:hypothetical protein
MGADRDQMLASTSSEDLVARIAFGAALAVGALGIWWATVAAPNALEYAWPVLLVIMGILLLIRARARDDSYPWVLPAVLLTVLLDIAALFAAWASLYLYTYPCGDNVCSPGFADTAMLVFGLAGVVTAIALLVTIVRRRHRAALVTLLVGLLIYLPWTLFSDAAVHGWDQLQWF